MTSLLFEISGDVGGQIEITEVFDPISSRTQLHFSVTLVSDTDLVGDLRAIFFDIEDDAFIDGLSVYGEDVTDSAFQEVSISNLGGGANVNGEVVNQFGKFDAGIEFGTSGIGDDDLWQTSFVLSHDSLDLTLDQIYNQDFALRITSVGTEDGSRNDSLKLGGVAPSEPDNQAPTAIDDFATTDEDSSVTIDVLGNDSDPDAGDFLTVTGAEITAGAGTVVVSSQNELTYDPGTAYDYLAVGETATVMVSYDIEDSNGGTDSAFVTITITGAAETAPLFTTSADDVDFNTVVSGTYVDGTQYNALDGNDMVTLADDATSAAAAGYVVGTAFNAGLGDDTVFGGSVGDTIQGDAGADQLFGNAGADVLDGGNDNDLLNGGEGDDTLYGQAGDDQISAGTGLDLAYGGSGNDTLNFSDANAGDLADGGEGTDRFFWAEQAGIASNIVITDVAPGNYQFTVDGQTIDLANIEQIVVRAGDEDDVISGSALGETLNGDDGNDTLTGGAGDDQMLGGSGIDTVDYSRETGGAGVTVDLAAGTATDTFGDDDRIGLIGQPSDVENIIGSARQDLLTGNAGANFIDGGAGADNINGGTGNDVLLGSSGVDRIQSGAGDDYIDGGDDFDLAYYNDEMAGVTADLMSGTALAQSGTDTLVNIEGVVGSRYDDVLIGTDGFNILEGWFGNDEIRAGGGNDFLTGSFGDDILDGGDGLDGTSYSGSSTGVHVDLAAGFATGGFGNDTLISIENVDGSLHDDTIIGSADNNFIRGQAGNDTLTGGGGFDTFEFQPVSGADVITDFVGGAGSSDVVQLIGRGIATRQDAIDLFVQVGNDAYADLGNGDSILLQNVLISSLAEDDFIV